MSSTNCINASVVDRHRFTYLPYLFICEVIPHGTGTASLLQVESRSNLVSLRTSPLGVA
jgi:hypothetical protein